MPKTRVVPEPFDADAFAPYGECFALRDLDGDRHEFAATYVQWPRPSLNSMSRSAAQSHKLQISPCQRWNAMTRPPKHSHRSLVAAGWSL